MRHVDTYGFSISLMKKLILIHILEDQVRMQPLIILNKRLLLPHHTAVVAAAMAAGMVEMVWTGRVVRERTRIL